mmetsp:Transcript_83273/g.240962  ORF Transcript_83273/g.240962 Transcript_83273/m.240962 type:complete len:217 (+) Transcript_83273:423-1073(+)
MDRRTGVHRPDHHLQLRQHRVGRIHGVAHHMQHADALAIQPQVFREGLAHVHFEAHGHEEPNGEGVLVQGPRRVALVSAVHKRHKFPLLHDGGNLLPLILRRVHPGGVVGTGVQQDVSALGGILLQCLEHAFEVEAPGLRLVVRVCLHSEAGLRKDGVMVAPCWVRHPNLVRLRPHEALDELRRHSQGARAGKSLHGRDPPLCNRGAVVAENEPLR